MTTVTIYVKEYTNANLPWIKVPTRIQRIGFKLNGVLYSSFVGYSEHADIKSCRDQIERVAKHYLNEEPNTLKIFAMEPEERALYKYAGMRFDL